MEAHIAPARAQFEAFKALPRDAPVEMLNLVRFREVAAYPAAHPRAAEGLTGAEAYALSGRDSGPVLARGAVLAMVTDPEYQAAGAHRQAAVETSRLIRCGAAEAGPGFG